MSEEKELPPWRKKFLASRMAFESILFEKELSTQKKENPYVGFLVVLGIWLLQAALLAQWAFRRGYFFTQADSECFGAVLRYAAYLKSQGFWALLKPDFSGLTLTPPLYYLAYVPVLDFVTKDLNAALVIVNSFFMLVLALSVYLAVRRSRPAGAGWLGAAMALSFPFVLETARRPAPEMALMALAAAMYACYIRSDEFEHPRWTFAFALALSLGFFAHRFFWIFALPLLPFIVAGLANPLSRDELFKGFLPGLVVNAPWYLFIAAALAGGLLPLWGPYLGFWHYFGLAAGGAGLPLFLLGGAALAWMYFSVFMPYEKKDIVAAWFWVPYLLLAFLVRGSRPELLYPALIPLAIAVPVMTPHKARRYLLAGVLALGALNQSGLLRPVTVGGLQIAGLPLPPSRDYRAAEISELVATSMPSGGGLAAFYNGDANLSAATLRFAQPAASGIKFEDAPACPSCAAVIVHKTLRFGQVAAKDEKAFSSLRRETWFQAMFEKRGDLQLADTSRAEVYVKVPGAMKFLEEGDHAVTNLSFGGLKIPDGTLTLKGFDPATGRYASASLFAPAADFMGGDIYGLTLDIGGLSAAGPATDPFVPASVTSVKVRSARISAYALENYLSGRVPFLSDVKVSLDGKLSVSAKARGRDVLADFALSVKDGSVLEARPTAFSVGPLNMPDYFLRLFTLRYDFSGNPYGVSVSGVRISGQLLELY